MVNPMPSSPWSPWNVAVNHTGYATHATSVGAGHLTGSDLTQQQGGNSLQDSFAGSSWQPSELSSGASRQLRLMAGSRNSNSTWPVATVASAATTSEAASHDTEGVFRTGLRARKWGSQGQRESNPNTGNKNWNGYSLGWTRRAVEDASGRDMPLLEAANSREAMKQVRHAGKLHHGQPPAGAIVFVPDSEGVLKMGIANRDGDSFRTPGQKGLVNRDFPEGKVAWMAPPGGKSTVDVKDPHHAEHDDNKDPHHPKDDDGKPTHTTGKTKPKKDNDSGPRSPIGLKARSYGTTKKGKYNWHRDSSEWGGWCLGWTWRAISGAAGGKGIPLLSNAQSAAGAYASVAKAGKIRYGNPPPGAIVFWDGTNGHLHGKEKGLLGSSSAGHIAIMNPNGKSYRGTSSKQFFDNHNIGDQKLSNSELKRIAWTMPEWLLKK